VTDPTLMVVLPLLGGFLLPLVYRAKPLAGQLFGPAVLLVVGAVGCLAWLRVQSGGPWVVPVGGFAAPIGIVFYVDRLAVLFALLTTLGGLLLWPLGLHDRVREAALTLLLIGGSCGLALSGDLFNLYVFYELVAVASYGLAASSGQPAGHAAAVRFLVLSALGSALALLGIALVYGATGTLNLAQLSALSVRALSGPLGLGAFALMMVGFGVKAELFPVNTWVPEVYAAAPARVSGLLAGVVSKLALLILLRLLVLAFAGTQAPLLLLAVGVLGLASGELAAFRSGWRRWHWRCRGRRASQPPWRSRSTTCWSSRPCSCWPTAGAGRWSGCAGLFGLPLWAPRCSCCLPCPSWAFPRCLDSGPSFWSCPPSSAPTPRGTRQR
jgi:formate hydrogenlyase subunit 3/multisubunit Na+/H+ antiporter MnhD subunit